MLTKGARPLWTRMSQIAVTSLTRMRDVMTDPNLIPRAHVSFGQYQHTELWNNQQSRP